MVSKPPFLEVNENIDDEIEDFCEDNSNLEPEAVLRDIARIVCIANLVHSGQIDGKSIVLCGGMAMRCLDSPRMSVFDGDLAGKDQPVSSEFAEEISYEEYELSIKSSEWTPGKNLTTFVPVKYSARFSELPGADSEFSLSITNRGIELPSILKPFNHRYPFKILKEEIEVPIMDPKEILAEKTVAWWLFEHAKHYNDIGYLSLYLQRKGLNTNNRDKAIIKSLVRQKMNSNIKTGGEAKLRAENRNERSKRDRLENPENYVDSKHNFSSLSYINGIAPPLGTIKKLVKDILVPILFED